jgi:UDP-GlcNAc3NAcA epimerase
MKIISIVGTRPQFLKLAPLSNYIKESTDINHIIIHTGQHYDDEMSEQIFNVLGIPNPNYLLEREDGSSRTQYLSYMMIMIEKIFKKEKPDKVIVFGDCDTTLAGALVCNMMGIYLVHIESGMRSYRRTMPEEVNRVLTDQLSNIRLCSTKYSLKNLNKEMLTENNHYVGNLQHELLKLVIQKYKDESILNKYNLTKNNFVLCTIHRNYNTTKERLEKIANVLGQLNKPILFPIHPRTKNKMKEFNLKFPENVILINPLNYFDLVICEKNCEFIMTDSGGIQAESFFLGKKTIVLRDETEWIDAILAKNNILINWEGNLLKFIKDFLEVKIEKYEFIDNVSERIIDLI